MKWYRKLYLGEVARKKKYNIWARIRRRSLVYDAYLITLASNEDNLLDIIKADYYYQPHFRKTIYDNNIYIVGLACGYDEALEVVCNIIEDVYNSTGNTDVRDFFKNKIKGRQT